MAENAEETSRSETEWLAILSGLPAWKPPSIPTLVIAPHPDDETLGAGGLIAKQRAAGLEVRVVAVTDGENAYANTPGLGALREAEQEQALARLSVPREYITRLRFPDGNVTSFEPQLEDRIAPLVSSGVLVVTPWRNDRHPDHEACGRVAERLAKRAGARLCSYFFWTWHWGSVADLRGAILRRFALEEKLQQAKREALQCHQTQLHREGGGPVLPELLLKPARRPFEVFAVWPDDSVQPD
jgi:LmbE family N-acetylglucosaminyl deacetylase